MLIAMQSLTIYSILLKRIDKTLIFPPAACGIRGPHFFDPMFLPDDFSA